MEIDGRVVEATFIRRNAVVNLLDDGSIHTEITMSEHMDVNDLREWANNILELCNEIAELGEETEDLCIWCEEQPGKVLLKSSTVEGQELWVCPDCSLTLCMAGDYIEADES